MFRVSTLALVGSSLLTLQGCEMPHGPSVATTITVTDAKLALIDLAVKSDDADFKYFLEPLKKAEPALSDGGKTVTFGPWTCNLVERTFVLAVATSELLLQYTGVFYPSDDGRWLAKIESKTQT